MRRRLWGAGLRAAESLAQAWRGELLGAAAVEDPRRGTLEGLETRCRKAMWPLIRAKRLVGPGETKSLGPLLHGPCPFRANSGMNPIKTYEDHGIS